MNKSKSSFIEKYLSWLILCLTLIVLLVSTFYSNIKSRNYYFEDLNFSINADGRWELIYLPRGVEFRNNGVRILKVLVMNDPLMSEEVLFSDQTLSNIRKNYHEYYDVGTSAIEFEKMEIHDLSTLKVVYSDGNLDDNPIYQHYYILKGTTIYLLEFKQNNFTDYLLESFKIHS